MIPLDDKKTNAVSPSYLQVLHLWIQPTCIENIQGKKNSRKFQKAKFEFATCQQLFI